MIDTWLPSSANWSIPRRANGRKAIKGNQGGCKRRYSGGKSYALAKERTRPVGYRWEAFVAGRNAERDVQCPAGTLVPWRDPSDAAEKATWMTENGLPRARLHLAARGTRPIGSSEPTQPRARGSPARRHTGSRQGARRRRPSGFHPRTGPRSPEEWRTAHPTGVSLALEADVVGLSGALGQGRRSRRFDHHGFHGAPQISMRGYTAARIFSLSSI